MSEYHLRKSNSRKRSKPSSSYFDPISDPREPAYERIMKNDSFRLKPDSNDGGENIYERQYENITFDPKSHSTPDQGFPFCGYYENVEFPAPAETISDRGETGHYDVPQNAIHIYREPPSSDCESEARNAYYQVPNQRQNFEFNEKSKTVPRSAQLVLKTGMVSCEKSEPDIPSPDYISDEEIFDEGIYCGQLAEECNSNDQTSEEEGLETIVEEPEEESGDDYVNINIFMEQSRNNDCKSVDGRSSEGSEGIGSLAESTVSTLEKLSEDELFIQSDRSIEFYKETVRQRNSYKPKINVKTTFNKPKVKINSFENIQMNKISSLNSKVLDKNSEVSDFKENYLPSVKSLRGQFENVSEIKIENSSKIIPKKQAKSYDLKTNSKVKSETEVVNSNILVESGLEQIVEEQPEQKTRIHLTKWDPEKMLEEMYAINYDEKNSDEKDHTIEVIEGYLEKLPSGRRKATFWNAWKTRYFRVKDGFLYYYQGKDDSNPNMTMQLMGGKIDSMDTTMLGIDDCKGRYVVVRCSSQEEAKRWKQVLQSHTEISVLNTIASPYPIKDSSIRSNKIIIDFGSFSIRAGFLYEVQITLPQLYFPSVYAEDKSGDCKVKGLKVYEPSIRASCDLKFPFRGNYFGNSGILEKSALRNFLEEIFDKLSVVNKSDFECQISIPSYFTKKNKVDLFDILFQEFQLSAVNLTDQSILALYSYKSSSGIVVDIGGRLDITPVIEGYVVKSGLTRLPYGGHSITSQLSQSLPYSTTSAVSCLIANYICQSAARVSSGDESAGSGENVMDMTSLFPRKYRRLREFSPGEAAWRIPEGLFDPNLWGVDGKGLHHSVFKAINECGMDARREMSRSIFLAGGLTCIPGLASKLEKYLENMLPTGKPVVHASPYRQHASYIGSQVLASSKSFDQVKINYSDWMKNGEKLLKNSL